MAVMTKALCTHSASASTLASGKAAAKSEQEVARIAVTDAQLNGFEDDREVGF